MSGLAHQDERRPVVWVGKARFDLDHSLFQGAGLGETVLQAFIEVTHQLSRRPVIDGPQTDHQRGRPGVEKAARKAQKFIALITSGIALLASYKKEIGDILKDVYAEYTKVKDGSEQLE